jgi:hypothetical protein
MPAVRSRAVHHATNACHACKFIVPTYVAHFTIFQTFTQIQRLRTRNPRAIVSAFTPPMSVGLKTKDHCKCNLRMMPSSAGPLRKSKDGCPQSVCSKHSPAFLRYTLQAVLSQPFPKHSLQKVRASLFLSNSMQTHTSSQTWDNVPLGCNEMVKRPE